MATGIIDWKCLDFASSREMAAGARSKVNGTRAFEHPQHAHALVTDICLVGWRGQGMLNAVWMSVLGTTVVVDAALKV